MKVKESEKRPKEKESKRDMQSKRRNSDREYKKNAE